MKKLNIETIKPHYAPALEQLQRLAFPTLGETELIREEHYRKHCEIFPEGNFVALAEGKVVGAGGGFFINFDFDDHHHTFSEIIAGGFYTNHDPHGEYYYGADICVHPKFRRRGIGTMLYAARKDVIKKYNRKGMIAGGLIPNFANHKATMTAHEYVNKVIKKEIYDRTLTFQLNHGFIVRGIIENYIVDEASDNWSTFIVWENPDYRI